ncbi:MAG: hypothetical protein JNM77_08765 [Pseudonocardia sp.]|nr:hypothetical protein [Pseudonocardia sp.]
MSTVSTVDDLLGQAFGVEDVPLPGGGLVKVRPLSRAEALKVEASDAADVMEQRLVAAALVEPKLTEAQVAKWQEVSPAGQIQAVVEAITRISGMDQNAGKQAYADFRE